MPSGAFIELRLTIAARAGLTKGAIYDNFASKDELFLACVATWAAERAERFPWPTDASGTLRERLRRLAEGFNADAAEAPREAPLRAEFLLYTLTHAEMRERVAESAHLRLEKTRERLRRFIRDDELSLPIDEFVVLLEALVPGLMFIRSQSPGLVSDEMVVAIFKSERRRAQLARQRSRRGTVTERVLGAPLALERFCSAIPSDAVSAYFGSDEILGAFVLRSWSKAVVTLLAVVAGAAPALRVAAAELTPMKIGVLGIASQAPFYLG